jgi:Tol biopolymer transport system component
VSVTGDGGQLPDGGGPEEISADGRMVAFGTASSLTYRDEGGWSIYVRDRWASTTRLVSVGLDGTATGADYGADDVSADGRFVAWGSYAPDLVPGDTNDSQDVFVRDLSAGVTERVSISTQGVEADDWSGGAELSEHGRFVVFGSAAQNLVRHPNPSEGDVYIRDRRDDVTRLIIRSPDGYGSGNGSLSAHGRYVAFFSSDPGPVPGDTNNASDVFIHSDG